MVCTYVLATSVATPCPEGKHRLTRVRQFGPWASGDHGYQSLMANGIVVTALRTIAMYIHRVTSVRVPSSRTQARRIAHGEGSGVAAVSPDPVVMLQWAGCQ